MYFQVDRLHSGAAVCVCCVSSVRVSVAYPPDTDTPGFEQENKTKPPETSRISPPEVYPAVRAAKFAEILRDVAHNTHTANCIVIAPSLHLFDLFQEQFWQIALAQSDFQ
jgi:hypothetical protein